MRHAALGALLLAIVFILAVAHRGAALFRARRRRALIPLAALGAALNYYFAFAPPAWIRRMWQSSELYGFLSDRALAGGSPSRNRRAESAVHVRGLRGWRHRRFRRVLG